MALPDYDPGAIERRWQERWERSGTNKVDLTRTENKLYCLVMFSYPSGDKLHIGHWYNFGPTDTWARFKRMQGYRVFEPMGFDAFGLPAENYAIKTGIHPRVSTRRNVETMRAQLRRIGAMYDWDYYVDTSAPEYYRWTQWLFLQLYRAGLAYRKEAPVNWCPSCQTVLANEQVEDGRCERCGSTVTKKDLVQWFFRITAYAERLLAGLERIQWPEKTKAMQTHWIGKSSGAECVWKLADHDGEIRTFTTRVDTLFGVSFLVLAPEHPLVPALTDPGLRERVEDYREAARRATEIERTSTERPKTGVALGADAIHPLTGARIPIWIADYVLLSYGTGAVQGVPAHDQRDWEFARAYGLPRPQVIEPRDQQHDFETSAYPGEGTLCGSPGFDGVGSEQAREVIAAALELSELGRPAVTYRLRDWLVSRQRYWGAPIPIVHCPSCGEVPVPEEQLPVLLPEDVDFQPTGESPLARSSSFVTTTCPKCDRPARRDVDTMDTFVDSSWYFLRYPCAQHHDRAWDPELVNRWLPVDQYVGGAEHAVLHLLYARFVTMALYDLGLVGFEEPFARLLHQGMITHAGAKMSKSHGNVVSPDPFVEQHGADCFRTYLMYMGDYQDGGDWSDSGIAGMDRFLRRVYRLVPAVAAPPAGADASGAAELAVLKLLHQAIRQVSLDLERFRFNTALARLIELEHGLSRYADSGGDPRFLAWYCRDLVRLLAPFTPHLGEELWARLGQPFSVFDAPWPQADPRYLSRDQIELVVQVGGKLRDRIVLPADAEPAAIEAAALASDKVQKALAGRSPRRVVVVPGRLVNLVP
jgi:leucyl-tRNA synthetase